MILLLSWKSFLFLLSFLLAFLIYGSQERQHSLIVSICSILLGCLLGWKWSLQNDSFVSSLLTFLMYRLNPHLRRRYPFRLSETSDATSQHTLSTAGNLYNLDHALLHLNLTTSQSTSLWCNMGFWLPVPVGFMNENLQSTSLAQSFLREGPPSFISACERLAFIVASAARLNLGSRKAVLDVGYGCGDQVCFWLSNFSSHLSYILGITHELIQ